MTGKHRIWLQPSIIVRAYLFVNNAWRRALSGPNDDRECCFRDRIYGSNCISTGVNQVDVGLRVVAQLHYDLFANVLWSPVPSPSNQPSSKNRYSTQNGLPNGHGVG